jgi:flagellar biosynthesis/type III secretory pathway M-ring protein FliF/YscJ
MAEAKPILTQLKEFWQGLSRGKRWTLIAVTCASLLLVLTITLIGSQVRYAPLYSELDTRTPRPSPRSSRS